MIGENPPRKASEWLLALLERPGDDALHRRFDAWLSDDPANAADWQEISRTYAVMGRTVPRHRDQWAHAGRIAAAPAESARVIPLVRQQNRRAPAWRRMVAGVAAVGIAASLVLTVFPALRWQLTADHATGKAAVTTLHLADGSTVRLGPDTALDVTFSPAERRVTLLRGAAFFEVTHDAQRPFRVETGLLETTVLGTAFEVTADEGGADVAVRKGAVRIDGNKGVLAEKLRPGEWLRLAADGQVTHGTRPIAQIAAWLQGHLIVKDRPAREVIDALRPYYRGLVIFEDGDLAGQPLTGIYDLSDPVAALNAVASALQARTSQISPWIFVISGG